MRSRRTSAEAYRDYFTRKVRKFGESLATLDYGSSASQRRKFGILADGIRPRRRPLTLLDLGCGFGDFLGYLRTQGREIRRYVGLDLVPDIVEVARRKHPEGRFEVRDVLREGIAGRYDYAVANGIFYIRAPDSPDHLRRTVRTLWDHCREGVLFNARSSYADAAFVRRERHLYQYDPVEVLDFCLGLTRTVVLRHDYMPHEFTVYMYRDVGG